MSNKEKFDPSNIEPFTYKEEVFKSINVKVESPDGTMYVTVLENEGTVPFRVIVNIGKAGSALNAWASCLADFVSDALPRVGVNSVIAKLLNVRGDRVSFVPNTWTHDGLVTVHSGPEAIAYALIKYRTEKQRECLRNMGISEEDDLEDFFRPANSA
jgi:hypothetical protein